MDDERFKRILGKFTELNALKEVSDDLNAVVETMESAGCTGSCKFYDEDGLPDCSRCSELVRDG